MTYLIAELGSNWKKFDTDQENYEFIAKQAEQAQKIGFHGLKFQLFNSKKLVGVKGTDTFSLDQLVEWNEILKPMCNNAGLDFLCTFFDLMDLYQYGHNVPFYKVASSDASDDLFIKECLYTEKDTIISIGGMTFDQVIEKWEPQDNLIIMECIGNYPAKKEHYNLEALYLLQKMGYRIGISDHTKGEIVNSSPIWDKLKLCYYEVHVDFYPNDGQETPDSPHSIDFNPFIKNRDQKPWHPKQLFKEKHLKRWTERGFYRPQ